MTTVKTLTLTCDGMPVFPGLGAELNQLIFQQRTSVTDVAKKARLSRQTLHVMLAEDRASDASVKKVERALGARLGSAHAGTTTAPDPSEVGGQWEPEPDVPDEGPSATGVELEEYVSNMDLIVRTLRTTPGGPLSIQIKLALLDGVKGAAADAGATLPREYYEIRRRVMSGEL